MRIQGPMGSAGTGPAAAASRRAPSGTFTVGEGTDARTARAPSALHTVGGIDALIALQGVEDATERRRNAVKRGRIALDALDDLKIGLLGGTLTPATLNRLRSAAAVMQDGSGEPGLDGVLGEIALRIEVEIAKMQPR